MRVAIAVQRVAHGAGRGRLCAAEQLVEVLGILARACSEPSAILRLSSPAGSALVTSAARRNARTRYVGAPLRSSWKAICRSAHTGSTGFTLEQAGPRLVRGRSGWDNARMRSDTGSRTRSTSDSI